METLDLRHVGRLFIIVLENKPWNFEITAQAGAPSFTGATATMAITKNNIVIQTLTIGAGLTITAANKIAIAPAPLAAGMYNYTIEIIPITGDTVRIIDEIQATNG